MTIFTNAVNVQIACMEKYKVDAGSREKGGGRFKV